MSVTKGACVVTDQKLDIAAILIGTALSILVGLRWRSLRYSGTIFLLIPQAIVAAYRGNWTLSAIIMGMTIPFALVAVRCKRNGSEDRRRDVS
jgi:hypothetical protein